LNKITSLKGCIVCSNLNHESSDCKFQFKSKCFKCQKWHFGFLCVHSETKDESTDETNSIETSSNLIGTKVILQSSTEDDSLPLTTHSLTHALLFL
jgi:hypothetical protein